MLNVSQTWRCGFYGAWVHSVAFLPWTAWHAPWLAYTTTQRAIPPAFSLVWKCICGSQDSVTSSFSWWSHTKSVEGSKKKKNRDPIIYALMVIQFTRIFGYSDIRIFGYSDEGSKKTRDPNMRLHRYHNTLLESGSYILHLTLFTYLELWIPPRNDIAPQ